jgi:hypothetical protein
MSFSDQNDAPTGTAEDVKAEKAERETTQAYQSFRL